MIYLAIDNGVSGSAAALDEQGAVLLFLAPLPTFKEQDYTKAQKRITRIAVATLIEQLRNFLPKTDEHEESGMEQIPRVFIERPMVNPMRFVATCSAMRALEATLIALETLDWPVRYVDSREWQKVMLPKGVKGAADLKRASRERGARVFPALAKQIDKHGDADALLMAECARRERW